MPFNSSYHILYITDLITKTALNDLLLDNSFILPLITLKENKQNSLVCIRKVSLNKPHGKSCLDPRTFSLFGLLPHQTISA